MTLSILQSYLYWDLKYFGHLLRKVTDSEKSSKPTSETHQKSTAGKRIYVTGGGAYKFADLIENKLNLTVVKVSTCDDR